MSKQASEYFREVEVTYAGPHRSIAQIRGPQDIGRFMSELVGHRNREHFIAIYLDGRHRPVGFQIVSIGTATAALVHPREVFQPAILIGAVAIVVAHNHPSGDTTPSTDDREITTRLKKCGDLLGVEVLDSMVVSNEDRTWYSMKDNEPDLFR